MIVFMRRQFLEYDVSIYFEFDRVLNNWIPSFYLVKV